jgi:hypothetical protein
MGKLRYSKDGKDMEMELDMSDSMVGYFSKGESFIAFAAYPKDRRLVLIFTKTPLSSTVAEEA